jgi:tight adherence protein B
VRALRRLRPAPHGLLTRRRLRALRPVPRAHRHAVVPRRPRLVSAGAAAAVGTLAGVLAGPVAGVVATVYAVVAVAFWLRRREALARSQAHARALDGLAALAADLRAGLPPPVARSAIAAPIDAVPLIRDRVAAAGQVADRTGAPLADLLDRLEVDLRGLERVRLAAAAHAAGTRATAGLLAVLPLAGVGVGYGMGADPVQVLLHTRLGAACVAVAVLLQLAGLGWTGRLSRPGGTAR